MRHQATGSKNLGSKKQKEQEQHPGAVAPIADAVPDPPQDSCVLHALLNGRTKKNLKNSLFHSVSEVVTHRRSASGSSEQSCGIRTVEEPLSVLFLF